MILIVKIILTAYFSEQDRDKDITWINQKNLSKVYDYKTTLSDHRIVESYYQWYYRSYVPICFHNYTYFT